MRWENFNWNEALVTLAHVVIAGTAVYATWRGFYELDTAAANREAEEKQHKILVVLNASERWRESINDITNPAIELVSDMKDENLDSLYYGLELDLCSPPERNDKETENQCIKRKNNGRYGTFLNGNAIISKKSSRNIRITLVKYLNALEHISEIYKRGFGDRSYVYCNFLETRIKSDFFIKLKGFMDKFSKNKTSWTVYRTLASKGPEAQDITCPI